MGRRVGLDIFGPNGRYLGEIMGNDRLATNKAKAAHVGASFVPAAIREHQPPQPDRGALSLYAGFDDFRSSADS